MKIVFVSNFMNHHQLPLSKEFLKMEGIEYWFIATEDIPSERISMGYHDMNAEFPFVIRTYLGDEQKEKALKLCYEADVVIHGSAPRLYIKERLKQKKLTFKYSERIYKTPPALWTMPLRFIKYTLENTIHGNLYMLCSSAYTAYDYSRTKTFLKRTFKWGYFPQIHTYDNIDSIIDCKNKNSILWAGRLIDWKHPEIIIEIAKRLKVDGINFDFKVIGNGIMESHLKELAYENNLNNCVHFLGAMSPEEVRNEMIKSQIYLFTSDRKEGWGAVLNEAMNSGCAVIASNEIGSVPFLIEEEKNGLIYDSGNVDELYEKVKYLLANHFKQKELGINAYQTMNDLWNAKIAAERLVNLSKALINKMSNIEMYDNGPCSRAEIIRG